MTAQSQADGRDLIIEDHHQLRRELEKIEQAPTAREVEALLAPLVVALERHFKLEEDLDGLHDITSSATPAHIAKLSAVMDEHPKLIALANAALDKIRAEKPYDDVAKDVADFIARLRDHEERETEMLSEAVSTDMGGGD